MPLKKSVMCLDPSMNSDDFDNWVSTYIEYQRDPNRHVENHPSFWAVEKFMNLGRPKVNPWIYWEAILEILKRDSSEIVTGILAAGPLEDIIEFYGPQVIETIEEEARKNPAFRKLLKGVWESSTPDIWARVLKARS